MCIIPPNRLQLRGLFLRQSKTSQIIRIRPVPPIAFSMQALLGHDVVSLTSEIPIYFKTLFLAPNSDQNNSRHASMSLNYTAAFDILGLLNYTAQCNISTTWFEDHYAEFQRDGRLWRTESADLPFARSAWPEKYAFVNDLDIFDFYTVISKDNPGNWLQIAFRNIEADCLGPALANVVTFKQLDFAVDCQASVDVFGNTLCAVNSPVAEKLTVHTENGYRWVSTTPPPLHSVAGLKAIRKSWPSDSMNITNATLESWVRLQSVNLSSFYGTKQAADVCRACMLEFCTKADFPGNADVGGIGVRTYPLKARS